MCTEAEASENEHSETDRGRTGTGERGSDRNPLHKQPRRADAKKCMGRKAEKPIQAQQLEGPDGKMVRPARAGARRPARTGQTCGRTSSPARNEVKTSLSSIASRLRGPLRRRGKMGWSKQKVRAGDRKAADDQPHDLRGIIPEADRSRR